MSHVRALNRRYGRAGFRIDFGAGKLAKTESVPLVVGHVYSMGASTSPDLIEIVGLTSDRIQYRKPHGRDPSTRIIERWIGEDLIARGERTFKERRGVTTQEWTSMTESQREAQLRRHAPELFGSRRGRY